MIRIIGGKWRGRKIAFPNITDLRPTPDRIRETIFNWLAPYIVDSFCLDLFAGSGALSFEALSRGAKEVLALDQDTRVITALNENAKKLGAENVNIIQEDSIRWLKNRENSSLTFDIIFVDPPYSKKLISTCFSLIENEKWLNNNGFVYFENNELTPREMLPSDWEIFRSKKAGNVYYSLAKKIRKNT